MPRMLTSFYARPLSAYLVAALIAISSAAGPAEAMLLPASPNAAPQASRTGTAELAADLATVRKTLESAELRQRLMDYGLSPEATEARINSLSDEQLHRLASNMDSVQAGGDVLGALFALAIIAALVVLIIYILEGRIEIRNK
jgi:hypothetical protein